MRHSPESLVQPWEAPGTPRPRGPLPAASTRLALTPNQSQCRPMLINVPSFICRGQEPVKKLQSL